MISGKELIDCISVDIDAPRRCDLLRCSIIGMSNDELDTLEESLPNREADNMIRDAKLRNNYRAEKEAAVRNRNHSIEQLLAWYQDKKSHKVMAARKALQSRFLHLSYDEQMVVMRCLLKGGKTDLEWCYNLLRKWWSDELLEPIVELWDKQQDERCGWLITRYAPIDMIRDRIDALSYDSNYYRLCKRLAAEPWFVIDKEKLRKTAQSDMLYLWIMAHTEKGVSLEEAREIIYRRISETIYFVRANKNPKDNTYYDSRNVLLRLEDFNKESNFFLTRIEGMDKMLSSLIWMGYYAEVKAFLAWDGGLHEAFMRENSEMFDYLDRATTDARECLLYLFQNYMDYLANHFPAEYVNLFEKVTEELRYYYECVLKPVYPVFDEDDPPF